MTSGRISKEVEIKIRHGELNHIPPTTRDGYGTLCKLKQVEMEENKIKTGTIAWLEDLL